MQFTRDDYQLVLDYDEFVDCYFLQGDDDADSLRPAEDEHLRCFYTMYAEFSDESAGFDQALDEWCTTDEAYLACTGDDEACARREAIKTDALSHLGEGLGQCGQDRATGREANFEDRLSECCRHHRGDARRDQGDQRRGGRTRRRVLPRIVVDRVGEEPVRAQPIYRPTAAVASAARASACGAAEAHSGGNGERERIV